MLNSFCFFVERGGQLAPPADKIIRADPLDANKSLGAVKKRRKATDHWG